MATTEYWVEQFGRSAAAVFAEHYWSRSRNRDALNHSLSSRSPEQILEKTDGLFSRRELATYAVRETDLMSHMIDDLRRNGLNDPDPDSLHVSILTHLRIVDRSQLRNPNRSVIPDGMDVWSIPLAWALEAVLSV